MAHQKTNGNNGASTKQQQQQQQMNKIDNEERKKFEKERKEFLDSIEKLQHHSIMEYKDATEKVTGLVSMIHEKGIVVLSYHPNLVKQLMLESFKVPLWIILKLYNIGLTSNDTSQSFTTINNGRYKIIGWNRDRYGTLTDYYISIPIMNATLFKSDKCLNQSTNKITTPDCIRNSKDKASELKEIQSTDQFSQIP
ncbi:hypothetical protein ACTA71_008223 [Dictyostelium dimigraforme]